MVVAPMDIELHVASPTQNDTFFSLFNESMKECFCTIYPNIPRPMKGLEDYVMAWFTLFIFMIIVLGMTLYVIYALQECTKFIQDEVDYLTKKIQRHRHWLEEPHLH